MPGVYVHLVSVSARGTLSFLLYATTIHVIGRRGPIPRPTMHNGMTSTTALPQSHIGFNRLIFNTSTSLTGLRESHETHLQTAHRQSKLIDAGPRHSIDSCSRTPVRQERQRYWSAVSGAMCVRIEAHNATHYWENAPSLTRVFGAFTKLYKSTLERFPQAK